MRKRSRKRACISKQKLRTIHRGKKWGYGISFWNNVGFVYAEVKETVEAATSIDSATGELLRCVYSVLVIKDHQNIRSKCLVDEFSFTDIFLKFYFIWLSLLIAIMKRCVEWCALQLYCKHLLEGTLMQIWKSLYMF